MKKKVKIAGLAALVSLVIAVGSQVAVRFARDF